MSPLNVLKFLRLISTNESKWKLLVDGTLQSTNEAVKLEYTPLLALFGAVKFCIPISLYIFTG